MRRDSPRGAKASEGFSADRCRVYVRFIHAIRSAASHAPSSRERPAIHSAPDSDATEELLRSRDRKMLRELALVLQSVGVVHTLQWEGDECSVLVPPWELERCHRELDAYFEENRGWPPPEDEAHDPVTRGWGATAVLAALMLLMYQLESRSALNVDWRQWGIADSRRILEGEWWRTVTALCLHSDLIHLVGNVVFGCWFFLFLAQALGGGVAGLTFVLAGAFGNFLAATSRTGPHLSLGASTAVFGLVGALGAFWSIRRRLRGRRLVMRLAPLILGMVMLGLLGVGGERTDAVAHVCGLAAGAVLGAWLAWTGHAQLQGRTAQVICAGLAVATVVAAWIAAIPA